MASQRSRIPGTENRISRAVTARRAQGHPLLDLTESNPTRTGLPYPEDLLEALSLPEAMHYQPHPRGLPEARQAIADYHHRSGLPVDPQSMWLTSGTSEAYGMLFKLLCDPGEEILVPVPGYPLFEHLARLEGVATRTYPLRYDGRWGIDLGALADAITPRTRAIVTVSPNNPTGSFLKRDELAALAALGLPLISDEVFSDFPLTEDKTRVRSALACSDVPVFCLFGLSKTAGLPQLKLSWIVAAGHGERTDMAGRLDLISDCYLSVGTPVQRAAGNILTATDPVREAIRARLRNNHAALLSAIGARSPISALHVEGGWYAILRLPNTLGEEAWVLRLLEENVLVHPGFFYDLEGSHVVLSLLTPEEAFRIGMGRIATVAHRTTVQ